MAAKSSSAGKCRATAPRKVTPVDPSELRGFLQVAERLSKGCSESRVSATNRQALAKLGQVSAKFDQHWPRLGRCWPNVAESGHILVEIRQPWPHLVKFGQHRSVLAGVWPNLAPKLSDCWLSWGRIRGLRELAGITGGRLPRAGGEQLFGNFRLTEFSLPTQVSLQRRRHHQTSGLRWLCQRLGVWRAELIGGSQEVCGVWPSGEAGNGCGWGVNSGLNSKGSARGGSSRAATAELLVPATSSRRRGLASDTSSRTTPAASMFAEIGDLRANVWLSNCQFRRKSAQPVACARRSPNLPAKAPEGG